MLITYIYLTRKISGFDGGGCEKCRLLECAAVWLLLERMMEEKHSSEKSVLARFRRRHNRGDGILHYLAYTETSFSLTLRLRSDIIFLTPNRAYDKTCIEGWARYALTNAVNTVTLIPKVRQPNRLPPI
jgi:hypothetical protein